MQVVQAKAKAQTFIDQSLPAALSEYIFVGCKTVLSVPPVSALSAVCNQEKRNWCCYASLLIFTIS